MNSCINFWYFCFQKKRNYYKMHTDTNQQDNYHDLSLENTAISLFGMFLLPYRLCGFGNSQKSLKSLVDGWAFQPVNQRLHHKLLHHSDELSSLKPTLQFALISFF